MEMNRPTRPSGDQPVRSCGVRISASDVGVIVLCAGLTWVAWRWLGQLAFIAPLVLAHFFLFCNVFRVRRRYELIWAACFIGNFIVHLSLAGDGMPSVLAVALTQLPITVFFIWKEIRSERYHGIGSRRINPDLPSYLSGEIP